MSICSRLTCGCKIFRKGINTTIVSHVTLQQPCTRKSHYNLTDTAKIFHVVFQFNIILLDDLYLFGSSAFVRKTHLRFSSRTCYGTNDISQSSWLRLVFHNRFSVKGERYHRICANASDINQISCMGLTWDNRLLVKGKLDCGTWNHQERTLWRYRIHQSERLFVFDKTFLAKGVLDIWIWKQYQ